MRRATAIITMDDQSILPTPESREQFLLECHNQAIDLVARMRAAGFTITESFAPYDAPTTTAVLHFIYGSFLKIYSQDGHIRRVSVSTKGYLIGEPAVWDLLAHPTISERRAHWTHQPTVEKLEAIERATLLLQRIGQHVAFDRARHFWGPNFRPPVAALSDAVLGDTSTIQIDPGLRRLLDEYEATVRETGFPSVLLPESERHRESRPDPRANDKPLHIPDQYMRAHVLQALRSIEGELESLAAAIQRGEQLPDVLEKRERGKELSSITKRVFWYSFFSSATANDLSRVKAVLDELEAECVVSTTCFGVFYRMREDPDGAHVRKLGHTPVDVRWLLMLEDGRALRYLREWCGLSRSQSESTLRELRGS